MEVIKLNKLSKLYKFKFISLAYLMELASTAKSNDGIYNITKLVFLFSKRVSCTFSII